MRRVVLASMVYAAVAHAAPDPNLAPLPKAPADPWAGVAGDKPALLPRTADDGDIHWKIHDEETACTAAIDHCFPALAWVVTNDPPRKSELHAAGVIAFAKCKDSDEPCPVTPWNVHPFGFPQGAVDHYIAYRTVPATVKTLVKGALVIVLRFPTKHPDSQADVFASSWEIGPVDHIDRELGVVYLAGQTNPYAMSSARVAVLAWKPGGKVTILGGKARKELGVASRDTIAPTD